MTEVAIVNRAVAVIVEPNAGPAVTIAVPVSPVVSMSAVGIQGAPGTGAEDAFLISNRLAELSTPFEKTQARTNLDLETIDLGTFN